jgi:hypothetical protein
VVIVDAITINSPSRRIVLPRARVDTVKIGSSAKDIHSVFRSAKMPKELFNVEICEVEEVHVLPGMWLPEQLQNVLSLAEYDEPVAETELLDMTLLVLQDFEEQVAGEIVLQAVFGESMSAGVRENLVDDLRDDRPWEQFSRVNQQQGVFQAVVLLQLAFPRRYGVPDALRIRLKVSATDTQTNRWLTNGPTALLLLRLLASAMDDDAVLMRLYGKEMQVKGFPHAEAILWSVQTVERSEGGAGAVYVCDIYSAHQWLSPLAEMQNWQGVATPD